MSDEALNVSPDEVQKLVADGAQLVDVRTDHEWEAGHIVGAAHIELAELNQRTAELDRDRPVVFYCRGDNRSDMAAAAFAADGYEATALAGGIQAWADDGRPLEPEGGYVAESGEAAAIIQARKNAGDRQIP
jgi:rhodanese-related sulfurtransferase